MEDIILSIKIPSAKVEKALQGYLKMNPNGDTMPDPEWVDPKDGSEAPQVAKYTNKEWITEKLKRVIISDVHGGLIMLAREALEFPRDNSVVE